MNFKYKAIKVDSLSLYNNEPSVTFDTYMVAIPFADLVKICEIKSISTNREVDEVRALKMTEYIKEDSAFYPPLIISTNKKEQIIYDLKTSEINISELITETNPLTIIDGQHRYKSIEMLLEQEEMCVKKQAVFIINGVSDLKRREIFIDINDKAKRVSTGDKERFKISLSNYFGLKYLVSSDYVSKINWGANQMKADKKFPYKFIVNSIKILLDEKEKMYKKGALELEELVWFIDLNKKIWDRIFSEFFKENSLIKPIETEVILISLFRLYKHSFSSLINKKIQNKDDSIEEDESDYFDQFEIIFEKFISKISEIETISKKNTNVYVKRDKLNGLFDEWGWKYA